MIKALVLHVNRKEVKMYNGSELKQYIVNGIFDAYQKLSIDNISNKDKEYLLIKLDILKELQIICEKRGRY